ncbi:hypothetical protein J7355_13510 [Endozoicomonas sp. G2_2]|uniref:hypothetical protein n=1 Tax=Endozoicomonas sp. G2_2 TaxID=2821092 RepID=UPI001AD9ED3C|nr:hypothetical protein [Endozoicomonas sp. G2_2]MBO9471113.1 hypothetical protein [Endozoicomonas sp. G2_2]
MKVTKSAAFKRLALAMALVRWDVVELFGRDSSRAQRRVIELTFELETDPSVIKSVSQEVSLSREAAK